MIRDTWCVCVCANCIVFCVLHFSPWCSFFFFILSSQVPPSIARMCGHWQLVPMQPWLSKAIFLVRFSSSPSPLFFLQTYKNILTNVVYTQLVWWRQPLVGVTPTIKGVHLSNIYYYYNLFSIVRKNTLNYCGVKTNIIQSIILKLMIRCMSHN